MKLKKILSIVLIISMLFGFLPRGLLGETVYAASPDYSWFGNPDRENYEINSARQLLAFAHLINGTSGYPDGPWDFTGKTIEMVANIDLTGIEWPTIGSGRPNSNLQNQATMFNGTFDGNGYTIKGLFVNAFPSESLGGLFGVVGLQSTIRNLIILEPEVLNMNLDINPNAPFPSGGLGAVAGVNLGLIENCHVVGGSVSIFQYDDVEQIIEAGGIVGHNGHNATINKCSSSADVKAEDFKASSWDNLPESFVGGIAASNLGIISNCYATGDLTTEIPFLSNVAGIAGLIDSVATVANCHFSGTITLLEHIIGEEDVEVGGIVGFYIENANVINSYYNSNKVPYITNSIGTGLSENEMKAQGSFSGWDFFGTWEMGTNYPLLSGMSTCQCEVSSFNITSSDEVVIPYGETTTTYQLEHSAAIVNNSYCVVEGHTVTRPVEYGYFIEPKDGSPENGASINEENEVVTFSQEGSYEITVVAFDPISNNESSQSIIITVTNEECTCSIPDFSVVEDQIVSILYPEMMGSYTFIDPNLTVEGDCEALGHQNKEINYLYEIIEQDSSITSASFDENTLTASGEGKVKVRITATLPNTDATPVVRITEVTFTTQLCSCDMSGFTFEGKSWIIPYGDDSGIEYDFEDPVDAIFSPCNIDGHSQGIVEYSYEVEADGNTAEARIDGKRLTVSKGGNFSIIATAYVADTEAVKSQTANFTVKKEFFTVAEYFKNIKALDGKDAIISWDTNLEHDITINVKKLDGTIVHTAIVNAKADTYKIPAEALTSTNDYIAEIIVIEDKPSVNINVSIEIQTSLLFNTAPTEYYDTVGEITLSWEMSRERSNSNREVTVKRGNSEYTNFTISGDSITIKGIKKPIEDMDTYTVNVISSYSGEEFASGSFPLSVYKTNDLEIINVLENNSILTELNPLVISNQETVANMTSDQLLEQANSLKLQGKIKLKQGFSTYGEDAYTWSIQDPTIATISGMTGTKDSYQSVETMLIKGLKDGETIVSVKHILTGETTSFKVTVSTLKNKLFILQTSIKTVVKLNYTANGENKSVISNSNGMVAVYEPLGITGSLSAEGIESNQIYMGGIDESELISGENTINSGSYPVSFINIAEATKIILQLSAKNGYLNTNQALTIKGFLIKNDIVIDTESIDYTPQNNSYENVIINFDTTKLDDLKSTDQLKFIYEISGGDYAPAYAALDASISGEANFGIAKIQLQLLQTSQSVYLNSIFLSKQTSEYFEDVSSRTQYVIINEKIPTRTLKALVCWPKEQVGIPTIVNSKGDTIGASNVTYKNLSLDGMNNGWQEVIIQLDSNLIEDGKSLKFSYSFYNSSQKTTTKIPNSFVVSNIMGVTGAEKYNSIPFTGNISTNSTGLKILGDKSFDFKLPSVLEVVMDYDFENDPLNGTFKMIIGYNYKMPNEDDADYAGLINNVIDIVEKGSDAMSGGKDFGFKVVGFMMGNAAYRNGDWVLIPTGGGIIGAAEIGYSFSQTTVVGIIPVNYGVELKAGVEATLLIDSTTIDSGVTKENFNDMFDFYLKVYGSIYAYGGIGFDIKILAARIGIFGELGLEYYFRTAVIDEIRRSGGQLELSGSIGIEAVAKFLFWKKRYVICEKGFEKDFKPNGFDFSEYGGFERPSLEGMTKMMLFRASNGKEYEIYEGEFEIEDRDYLSQPQEWNGGLVSSLKSFSMTNKDPLIKEIGTNVYTYADPILSIDGNLMVMLSEFGSKDINKTGAAYSLKNSEGIWSTPARIYSVETPASNLAFSGSDSFGAVAWESVKNPVILDEEDMLDTDVSEMINQAEIFASIYNGTTFTTTQITDNLETDMIPEISANNNKAIVVWQRSALSQDLSETEKNEILYSLYSDGIWSPEKILDTGNAGTVKNFSTAMASDGTAVITLSIDTDKDNDTFEDMEVFNHYIYQDGTKSSRIVITSNESVDSNPQVITRELDINGMRKEYFITGWYNEKIDENEQGTVKNVLLDVRELDGNKANGFVNSFGAVGANFSFIKSNDFSINTLGIVWSEAINNGNSATQTFYVKFLTEGIEGVSTTPSFEIVSADPNDVELYGIEAVAKKNLEGIDLSSIYLKKNIEIGLDNTLKTISTDIQSANIIVIDSAKITNVSASSSSAQIGSSLPVEISIQNNGFSKIIGFEVEMNGQEFLFDSVLLPDQATELNVDYMVENFGDITIKVTPLYSGGIEGKELQSSIEMLLPDIGIKSITQTGTGNDGNRAFDINLFNNGTKALDSSGYKVKVSVFEDFARETPSTITDLETDETKTQSIEVSDNTMLALIDEGKGKIRVGYKVNNNSYNLLGNKTLYISVSIINNEGELIKDLNYSNNEGGITFISPQILYPSQFEVTVVQKNIDGVTNADLTVRNLYLISGIDTLKLSLLDEEQVIEEKTIDINMSAESTMKQTVEFEGIGTNVIATFGSDLPEFTMISSTLTEFESQTVGYDIAPEPQTVTITNTGNQIITLKQPTSTKYIIGELSTTNLVLRGTATFTVQPKTGLALGQHNENITITGTNSSNASVFAQFTVIEDPDIATVSDAKMSAEGVTYKAVTQTDVMDETIIENAIKDEAMEAINDATVSVKVNKVSYTEPTAGSSSNPSGINGSYTFTVTISKGDQTETTIQKTIVIIAKAYTGVTNVQAVAAAKVAIVDGTVDVDFNADQSVKTGEVQTYVNKFLIGDAFGVIATVTHESGGNYSVAISKGITNETKTIMMTINESPDPDIKLVEDIKNNLEGVTYKAVTQTELMDETIIENAIKDEAMEVINDATVSFKVNKVSYTKPIAGSSSNPSGINGSYTFTITISKGDQTETSIQKTIVIIARAYTGVTDVQAVAAAKVAIVGGTVNVDFNADQSVKTGEVQTYVNKFLIGDAFGVIATVTHESGGNYSVAISKGSTNETKTIMMTINESPDPDIKLVEDIKNNLEGVTYKAVTQTELMDETIIENAIKDEAMEVINDATVSFKVNKVSYTKPIAGLSSNPSGINGSYTFTITISKGDQTETTIQKTTVIIAKAYTGVTDVQAVAAAKVAIVGGTVNVAFAVGQTVKTAVVQNYVNELLIGDAFGVIATVTHESGGNYSVAISKGSTNETKTIIMMINESPDPDIATVNAAKIAAESATYLEMTQGMAVDEEIIKNILKLKVDAAINNSSVTTIINKVSYTEAIEGTNIIPYGTVGNYIFTITVRKGGKSDITSEKTISIIAKPYGALPNYKVEGTVKDQENNTIPGANIKLMRGINQIGLSTQTDENGKFIIENVLNGTYNVVLSNEGIIMTKLITVSDANYEAGAIIISNGKRNSVVEIKGSLTPQLVVGGLDEQFNEITSNESDKGITAENNSVIIEGGSIEIKFVAEGKDDSAINAKEISATAILSGKTVGIFIDLSVLKTVIDSDGDEIPSQSAMLTEIPSLIEVYLTLPTLLQTKSNYAVYRYHGSEVDVIKTTPNEDGEKIELIDGNTIIKLTIKKFSTYAIAYGTNADYSLDKGINIVEIEESGSQGGGIIISTDKKSAIIAPEEGYAIAQVIFDGKNIGAIDTYTVTDDEVHTINAVFVKEIAIPFYFEQDKKVYIGFSTIDGKLYQYIAPDGINVKFEENHKNFEDNTMTWSKSSTEFVTEREIFIGTNQGVFSPNKSMTRAMFVTVIGRLYERSYGIVVGKNTFTDVNENAYYAKYVAWANDNGIIKGIGGNKFDPNDEVTREQMAVIILNFATLLGKEEILESLLEYSDSTNISSWAIEGVKYCQSTKIITGRNAESFSPKESATRAEVAVVIERFIKKIVSNSK